MEDEGGERQAKTWNKEIRKRRYENTDADKQVEASKKRGGESQD